MVFPFFMEPNVLPDDFCGHLIPHRTNEISVFPKLSTPQLLVHAWEILPNDLGAHRFKHLNHPGNGILWREGEKEMYMVFFNLHLGNFKSMVVGNFLKHLMDSAPNRLIEHPFSILGSPHQMEFCIINAVTRSLKAHAPTLPNSCCQRQHAFFIPALPGGAFKCDFSYHLSSPYKKTKYGPH